MSSSLEDTSDTMNKILTWTIVGYVVGGVLAIAFWCTVIYFVVRACKSASKQPREIHVHHDQPQIQYVVHQEPHIGPDGRPIVYASQAPPGQAPQYYYYAHGAPASSAQAMAQHQHQLQHQLQHQPQQHK